MAEEKVKEFNPVPRHISRTMDAKRSDRRMSLCVSRLCLSSLACKESSPGCEWEEHKVCIWIG
jgi:hypothetical protein